MYISEIQQRLINAIDGIDNSNKILTLAVDNGANPEEVTDTYHLALWFEGAPANVKLKLLSLIDEADIPEHGLRVCSICGKYMAEGYILADGNYYACSDECAVKHFGTQEDLDIAVNDMPDENFWTEWEQEI